MTTFWRKILPRKCDPYVLIACINSLCGSLLNLFFLFLPYLLLTVIICLYMSYSFFSPCSCVHSLFAWVFLFMCFTDKNLVRRKKWSGIRYQWWCLPNPSAGMSSISPSVSPLSIHSIHSIHSITTSCPQTLRLVQYWSRQTELYKGSPRENLFA